MQRADRKLVKADNVQQLEKRLQQGIDVNAVDGLGRTLLHYAAWYGSWNCLTV